MSSDEAPKKAPGMMKEQAKFRDTIVQIINFANLPVNIDSSAYLSYFASCSIDIPVKRYLKTNRKKARSKKK